MIIFLSILFGVIAYIVGAGATHGYAKHRWPDENRHYSSTDDNDRRVTAAILWPFYWMFVWPFTKTNEVTFSQIEKNAALEIARKKSRIEDLRATREELERTQAELERAEVEVEKEMSKL